VRAVVPDARAEVSANRPRAGLGRIGSAHRIAPLQDGAFGLQREDNYFAGAHEFGQLAEKGARRMHGVETLSLSLRKMQRLDSDDLKSGFLNSRNDFALQAAPKSVRLDDC
jgi:hypothetical protein